MELISGLKNIFMFLLCLFVLSFYQVHSQSNVFILTKYGGVASKTFDNSKALISAWNDACKWEGKGKAKVVIPSGTYLTNPVELSGPCKRPIKFINRGLLLAPPGPTNLNYWINFQYIEGLTISGGIYNGQGETVWDRFHHLINPAHSLLSLAFVNNTNIRKVHLKHSKLTHLTLFACNNLEIFRSTISSPENSPNTDGVKMANSSAVRVTDTSIASGDDCVAILTGSNDVNITRVRCGPGHGISIGSMGSNPGDEVKQINVRNCTFTKTLNGVRIKSWAKPNSGVCSGVSFVDIIMESSFNPIIIDQNYCPNKSCPKGDSHVQIDGVKFININGTSASEVAIDLQCSGTNPCKEIRLENIDIRVRGGKPASVLCSNVHGTAHRVKNLGSCLAH